MDESGMEAMSQHGDPLTNAERMHRMLFDREVLLKLDDDEWDAAVAGAIETPR
jgi:hypothetical protein